MKTFLIVFGMIIIYFNLSSSVYITVNDPEQNGDINCTTISEAMSYLDDHEESYLVEVFAINGEETIYGETFSIPVCTVTLKCHEADVGLVIIDSGTENMNVKGHTAITVQPSYDPSDTYIVKIDGFIILRSDYDPDEEVDSGIVIFTRNTYVQNCTFGSRETNQNFCKSIYFRSLASKSIGNIYILNCTFKQSCKLGEFAVWCEGQPNSDQRSYKAYIMENQFIDCGKGASISSAEYTKVIDNDFINNEFYDLPDETIYGLYTTTFVSFLLNSWIQGNHFARHDKGIYVDGCNPYDIFWNELLYQKNGIWISNFSNTNASILRNLIHTYQDNDNVIGIENWGNCSIKSNTLINTNSGNPGYSSTAIDLYYEGTIYDNYLANNILWDFTTNINCHDPNYDIEVNYCCFNGSIDGFEPDDNDCNLYNTDPLFISEDPVDADFCRLSEQSSCIDAGDPDAGLDPDGSPPDIGSFYFWHDYDTKQFSPGWQWVSFPCLTEQGTYNNDIYEQVYWNPSDQTPGLLQETLGGTPTIDGFLRIDGKRDELIYIEYIYPIFYDNLFDNMLFRHEGYKVQVEDNAATTYLEVGGERLVSYLIEDMPALENFWLGYYLPYPQNIEDAFGDFFGDINRVWAEDWYYDAHKIQRGGDPTQLPSSSTKGKTLEYGKMYIVQMYYNIEDFSWNSSSSTEEPTKLTTPQNFTFQEKADYEAIDVVDIPSDVIEIGVFEGEECVGAVVVEDCSAQILAYPVDTGRDNVPFTFRTVTGRGITTRIRNYLVLNRITGEFESAAIIPGQQDYAAVSLEGQQDEENNHLKPLLHINYPNPFNPETSISFTLPQADNIQLCIYNIKGQKVKTLYSGFAGKGKHVLIWDGKNNDDRTVSSGIYFYRLKTDTGDLTHKMLLMK
ncbi:MAG: T9SS type A sorting domain-containing protein [Candidatus Cloacimonetes bacterium]|nr:T9SS type A sorting domain-containing protein [Candidatus Cloacimonadota bacterium]